MTMRRKSLARLATSAAVRANGAAEYGSAGLGVELDDYAVPTLPSASCTHSFVVKRSLQLLTPSLTCYPSIVLWATFFERPSPIWPRRRCHPTARPLLVLVRSPITRPFRRVSACAEDPNTASTIQRRPLYLGSWL